MGYRCFKVSAMKNSKTIDEYTARINEQYIDEDLALEQLLYDIFTIEEVSIDYDRNDNYCRCGNAWGNWNNASGYLHEKELHGNAGGCCYNSWAVLKDDEGNTYELYVDEISCEEIEDDDIEEVE